MIAGLHYLKHLHDLSDEQVVKGWTENPYWQYFCGEEYFQHKMPIHPTTMTKWRNRPGKSGSEKLLIETIKAGLKSKTIKPGSLKKVTVDTTVQEKNIAFPTDSKLLNKARENLVKLSKEHGIKLRQNYNRVGPQYVLMASRYAHAKQFKRMKKMNNKLKSRLGRVKRDIERQLPNYSVDIQSLFEVALEQAQKLIEQEQHSKNKLYSLHAPEVECISKGKAHKPYEFGVKASIAVTNKEGFVIGAQSCPGNPYDGHTLLPQLEQIKQFTAVQPEQCFVDRSYHGHEVKDTKVFISGQKRGITRSIKKALKRRSAIEPLFNQLKNDWGMKQTWQKTRKVLHRWVHIIALGYIIPQLRAIKCPDPVLRLIDNTPWRKNTPITAGRIRMGLIRYFSQVRVRDWWDSKSQKFQPPDTDILRRFEDLL